MVLQNRDLLDIIFGSCDSQKPQELPSASLASKTLLEPALDVLWHDDVMKKNLPHFDFAFLSACQTWAARIVIFQVCHLHVVHHYDISFLRRSVRIPWVSSCRSNISVRIPDVSFQIDTQSERRKY